MRTRAAISAIALASASLLARCDATCLCLDAPADVADVADTATDTSSYTSAGTDIDAQTADAPAALGWAAIPPCPVARFEAMGAVLDGAVYVMGGFITADLSVTPRVDLYDPIARTWSTAAPLLGPETHGGVATLTDGLVIVGGLSGFPSQSKPHTWRYDRPKNQWLPGPSLPQGQSALVLVLLDGILHAIGGLAPDASTDTGAHWTLPLAELMANTGSWSTAPALPNPRNHLGGAVAGGRIIILGGRHGWDEEQGHVGDAHAFDPQSGTWTALPALPVPRSEIAASVVAVPGFGVVVAGGSTFGVKPTASVALLGLSNTFSESLPPLPSPRKGTVLGLVGRTLVAVTGSPTSTDPDAAGWNLTLSE